MQVRTLVDLVVGTLFKLKLWFLFSAPANSSTPHASVPWDQGDKRRGQATQGHGHLSSLSFSLLFFTLTAHNTHPVGLLICYFIKEKRHLSESKQSPTQDHQCHVIAKPPYSFSALHIHGPSFFFDFFFFSASVCYSPTLPSNPAALTLHIQYSNNGHQQHQDLCRQLPRRVGQARCSVRRGASLVLHSCHPR
jgi:hypothetical protein